MDFERAMTRVLTLIALLEKAEKDEMFDEAFRDKAKADRVALEIVVEWAMKAYEKNNELGAEMLNALHV